MHAAVLMPNILYYLFCEGTASNKNCTRVRIADEQAATNKDQISGHNHFKNGKRRKRKTQKTPKNYK